jgi:hypothetical protein
MYNGMSTEDPPIRKTVVLRHSMWDEIATYRKAERIESEMEAIRRLLSKALKDVARDCPPIVEDKVKG